MIKVYRLYEEIAFSTDEDIYGNQTTRLDIEYKRTNALITKLHGKQLKCGECSTTLGEICKVKKRSQW